MIDDSDLYDSLFTILKNSAVVRVHYSDRVMSLVFMDSTPDQWSQQLRMLIRFQVKGYLLSNSIAKLPVNDIIF